MIKALRAFVDPPWQYGIMHPSVRPLCRNFRGNEVWSNGGVGYVLFPTAEEAWAKLDDLRTKWPKGELAQAYVVRYRPGSGLREEWDYADVPRPASVNQRANP